MNVLEGIGIHYNFLFFFSCSQLDQYSYELIKRGRKNKLCKQNSTSGSLSKLWEGHSHPRDKEFILFRAYTRHKNMFCDMFKEQVASFVVSMTLTGRMRKKLWQRIFLLLLYINRVLDVVCMFKRRWILL